MLTYIKENKNRETKSNQDKDIKSGQNLLLCCRNFCSITVSALGVSSIHWGEHREHVCLPNVESNTLFLLRGPLLAVTHGSAPGLADFKPLERCEICKGQGRLAKILTLIFHYFTFPKTGNVPTTAPF
jgi:hypothetical protein